MGFPRVEGRSAGRSGEAPWRGRNHRLRRSQGAADMTCAANNICGRDPPPGSPGQASHPQSSPAIHSEFIEYAVFPGAYDPLLTCPIAKTELWGQNLSAPGISAARCRYTPALPGLFTDPLLFSPCRSPRSKMAPQSFDSVGRGA
ncbi:hypothetical protein NDU88_002163 [Pleurodeles waltl]|uniref:Uncharacterized protein n=1 Tax=Pleurodeles waltl TaxID=8319 RepID=A0AAV7PEJ6_PLEWA|nr:hypothetical protein NDU88_002163 [Pleurodeles waltl]